MEFQVGQQVRVAIDGKSAFNGAIGVVQEIHVGYDHTIMWVQLTHLHRLLTFMSYELEPVEAEQQTA
jgi:hypothetical protein